MKRPLGYADRISAAPGDTIAFKVSCAEAGQYRADIVRLICGDTNPAGPGFKETLVETAASGLYTARRQEVLAGSYVVVPDSSALMFERGFTIQAMIWPTTPARGRQALIGKWSESAGAGFALVIDETGALALLLGDGRGGSQSFGTGRALCAREWCFVGASYDAVAGTVRLYQEPVAASPGGAGLAAEASAGRQAATGNEAPLMMAAVYSEMREGRLVAGSFYNGKLDSPRLARLPLPRSTMEILKHDPAPAGFGDAVVGFWDFSRDISSQRVLELRRRRVARHDGQSARSRHEGTQLVRPLDGLAAALQGIRRHPFPR